MTPRPVLTVCAVATPTGPCPNFTEGIRCADHERLRRRAIGSSTARGYGAEWRRIRLSVLTRHSWTCHYCGGPADTVDHVIPKSQGGSDDAGNLVAACTSCNSAKGGRAEEAS